MAEPIVEMSGLLPHLPNEIWEKIFDYLPYDDVKWMRLVCRSWSINALTPTFIARSKVTLEAHTINDMSKYVKQNGRLHQRVQCLEIRNVCWSQVKNIFNKVSADIRQLILSGVKGFKAYDLPQLTALTISETWMYAKPLLDAQPKLKLQKFDFECKCKRHEELFMQILQLQASNLTAVAVRFGVRAKADHTMWLAAFQQLRNLRHFEISGGHQLLQEIINALPNEAPMQKLCFAYSDYFLGLVGNDMPEIVHKWATTLSSLSIRGISVRKPHLVNFAKLANLSELQLAGHPFAINMDDFFEVFGAGCCPSLRSLHLDHNYGLSDKHTGTLVRLFPNLEILKLNTCERYFTNISLAHIFQQLTGLRELVLQSLVSVTDAGFLGYGEKPYSIARLQQLHTLHLECCPHVTKRTLMNGCLSLPQLRHISLVHMDAIRSTDLRSFVVQCATLRFVIFGSKHTECQKCSRNYLLQHKQQSALPAKVKCCFGNITCAFHGEV